MKRSNVFLIAALVALALLSLAACPSKEPEEKDAPGNQVAEVPDGPRKVENDFVKDNPEENLDKSPFELDALHLGSAFETVMEKSGADPADGLWFEEGVTGIVSGKEAEGRPKADYYFHEGELVGVQEFLPQTDKEFEFKVGALTEQYGEPSDSPPGFMADTVYWRALGESDRQGLMFWADEKTGTVITGAHKGKGVGRWQLMHPERVGKCQGETYPAQGS